jgi:hypothetical protein
MKVNINAKTIKNVFNGEVVNYYDQDNEKCIPQTVIKKDTLKLFISYSHEDEDLKQLLDIHLASLKRDERIVTWNDRQIFAGQEWDTAIKEELNQSDLILLLISANFIASDYIWKYELANAIERHNSGNSVVIPIFCKPCEFSNMPFSKLQGLPKNADPVINHKNVDQAFADVVTGIKLVVDNILSKR